MLVPHIVRLPSIDEVNLRAVASGTEQIFQVRYDQEGNGRAALPPVGAQAGEPADQTPVTEGATPAEPAQTQPALPGTPMPVQPDTPDQAQQTPQQQTPEPAATQQTRFAFAAPSVELGVGDQTTVELRIEDAAQLYSSPLRLGFDPRVVRVTDITRGPFLEGDGMDLIFAKNIRAEAGQAAVNISRFPGTGGADGGGVLVTLHLEGVAPGNAQIRVISTGARDANAQPVSIPQVQLPVTVR